MALAFRSAVAALLLFIVHVAQSYPFKMIHLQFKLVTMVGTALPQQATEKSGKSTIDLILTIVFGVLMFFVGTAALAVAVIAVLLIFETPRQWVREKWGRLRVRVARAHRRREMAMRPGAPGVFLRPENNPNVLENTPNGPRRRVEPHPVVPRAAEIKNDNTNDVQRVQGDVSVEVTPQNGSGSSGGNVETNVNEPFPKVGSTSAQMSKNVLGGKESIAPQNKSTAAMAGTVKDGLGREVAVDSISEDEIALFAMGPGTDLFNFQQVEFDEVSDASEETWEEDPELVAKGWINPS